MSNGEWVSTPTLVSPWPIGNPDNVGDIIYDHIGITYSKAEELLDKLVGPTGNTGLLGDMASLITSAPQVTIPHTSLNTALTPVQSGLTMPVFNGANIVPIPTATYAVPTLDAITPIDTSGLVVADVTPPAAFTFSVTDTALPQDVYPYILARMLNDLQAGATGLDPVVEQAIVDRAKFRHQAERAITYQKLNNDLAGRLFMLPSGPLVSALTDFATEEARLDAEINNNIITTQADLAQKNSQFMMQQAVALEALIRQTNDKANDRALEEAKANATLIIQDYSERVKAYVATWEGKKAYVQAMAENLKAVLDGNRGKLDTYKAQYDALKTQIEAATTTNKGVTDVYLGQIQGFGEAEKATASQNATLTEILKAQVMAADADIRAAIAQAEASIKGYSSEMELRQKVSSDIAHVTAQTVASMLAAVNMGMNVGYSSSDSASKSVSSSASLSESHSYEHDPTT